MTGFEIADAAVTGKKAEALEALAWAGHHGVAHVLVADALAEAIHAIARVRSVGGRDANSSAAELGMPPWRVRKVAGQAQGWTSEAVATAMGIVATLNGEVKGQAPTRLQPPARGRGSGRSPAHRAVRTLRARTHRRLRPGPRDADPGRIG